MSLAPPGFESPSFRRSADVGQVAAILDAAEQCFSRAGYAGTALHKIAEKAGVSKSLLHYHFASKEHLFVEVQMRAYERLAARVTSAVAPLASGKERGIHAFDALIHTLRETNDLAVQAELWAGALSNEKLRSHVVRLREFFRELLLRSIGEILGEDLRRLPIPLDEAADLVWATLNGIGIESAFGEARERTERALRALRHLTLIALGEPAERSQKPAPRPRSKPPTDER